MRLTSLETMYTLSYIKKLRTRKKTKKIFFNYFGWGGYVLLPNSAPIPKNMAEGFTSVTSIEAFERNLTIRYAVWWKVLDSRELRYKKNDNNHSYCLLSIYYAKTHMISFNLYNYPTLPPFTDEGIEAQI